MKILLLGPYPPPHGGVSVHVAEARKRLEAAGVPCRVANIDPRAPASGDYIGIRTARELATVLWRHARGGWTLHLHTNGHNRKSWLIALACGLAGRLGPGCALTLHSGMMPAYLAGGNFRRRALARSAARLYDAVVPVNEEIRAALAGLGVAPGRLRVIPAFLAPDGSQLALPAALEERLSRFRPLLAATLFFRPEYGFEVLVSAVALLRRRWPGLGCAVMGSGEQEAQAEALVEKEGLADSLMLLGDLPHATCLAVMRRAALFVRPTIKDGDATSVREALALGTPVVASNVGARPAGVLLFEAGNPRRLAEAIEAVLARAAGDGSARVPAANGPRSEDAFPDFLEIYARILRSAAGERDEPWESFKNCAG